MYHSSTKTIKILALALTMGTLFYSQSWGAEHTSSSEEAGYAARQNPSTINSITKEEALQQEIAQFKQIYTDHIQIHADIKTVIAKTDKIFEALMKLKDFCIQSNSDFIDPKKRCVIDNYFQHILATPNLVLGMNAEQSLLKTISNNYTLMDGTIISYPTFTPIIESLQGLDVLTKENAINTQNVLNLLIPQLNQIKEIYQSQEIKLYKLIEQDDNRWNELHQKAKDIDNSKESS